MNHLILFCGTFYVPSRCSLAGTLLALSSIQGPALSLSKGLSRIYYGDLLYSEAAKHLNIFYSG